MSTSSQEVFAIDSHCHYSSKSDWYSFEKYLEKARRFRGSSGSHVKAITGTCVFSAVEEIYPRGDADFVDSEKWRRNRTRANKDVLDLTADSWTVTPYLFVWNDFAADQIAPSHKGVKWHRHVDEPVYQYRDHRCATLLEEIRKRRMPIVYEESYENTVMFVSEPGIARGIPVIIPHFAMLNGGYEALREAGIWALPDVWVDTALSSPSEIKDYVTRYGHKKVLYGSDFPFGNPDSELRKVLGCGFGPEIEDDICRHNIVRLHSTSNVAAK